MHNKKYYISRNKMNRKLQVIVLRKSDDFSERKRVG